MRSGFCFSAVRFSSNRFSSIQKSLTTLVVFCFAFDAWMLPTATAQQNRDPRTKESERESESESKGEVESVQSEIALAEQVDALIQRAGSRLVALQEDDGAWPYEGVYRVRRRIPVGYRIGGTAIVCDALLTLPDPDEACTAAIEKGIRLILEELQDRRMESSTEDTYDVRVWGHIYALKLFAELKVQQRFAELHSDTDPWIARLTEILQEEEIGGGGWNYANQRRHAAFVTAPAVQSLLLAKESGQEVDADLLQRAADALIDTRSENGAYAYSGKANSRRNAQLPGSIARSAVCEATLLMLGKGDTEHLQLAIDAFHEHWQELEKRRKKTGTHEPPYGVAPYYFYYGHRYLAQGISLLPEETMDEEFQKFVEVLLRTKDDDDTWNDRVFDRSKAFGTAMALLALSESNADAEKGK